MADHEINANVEQEQTSAPAPQPDITETPVNPPAVVEPEEESVEESESEQEDEEDEQTHQGPHLQLAVPTHQLVWQYTQQYSIQALLWLQFLWNLLSVLASHTQTITKGIARSIQSKDYVFFQGSNYPYRLQDFVVTGPGIAPVEWYYNADKKLFLSSELHNTTTEYQSHHLEWLSAEVKYNNLVLYDITDYLQQVRWAGRTKPSAARVMSAWSLHSGVVLTGIDGISLKTINEDGTESVLHFRV